MNTLQNVYNKLADKTELAKHEVELASVADLKKISDITEKSIVTFYKWKKEAQAYAKTALGYADEYGNNRVKLYDLMQALERQAKELGIDIKETNEYKKAINVLFLDKNVEKEKADLRNIL